MLQLTAQLKQPFSISSGGGPKDRNDFSWSKLGKVLTCLIRRMHDLIAGASDGHLSCIYLGNGPSTCCSRDAGLALVLRDEAWPSLPWDQDLNREVLLCLK